LVDLDVLPVVEMQNFRKTHSRRNLQQQLVGKDFKNGLDIFAAIDLAAESFLALGSPVGSSWYCRLDNLKKPSWAW
jgi:hypothetical protein